MKQKSLEFALPVSILKEGESFIAYSPALDLSTVGKTFQEAKDHLEEAVQIFFAEITEKGTLEEVLLELGWKKQAEKIVPPLVVSHQTEQFSVPCQN